MLKKIIFILIAFIFSASIVCAQDKTPVFNIITIASVITAPTARYIDDSIEDTRKDGAAGLIILLDTPGGMDTAMRDIAKSLLNAPVPVIVYVYPQGARAASAGVIITIAAHIAAMAPGTNIGAAHPVAVGIGGSVEMDETMAEKVENDAVAYVRSIAKAKGRSEEWAEKAVRKSESITAEEALKLNVIDFVAADVEKLLAAINNKTITMSDGRRIRLSTKNVALNYMEMGTRQKILTTISDPNIAYILLLVGMAGLYFEFSNPGAILPGVIGGIALLLAFFGLATLPVNYAGILLIIFGVILFFAEIKVMSNGILSVGGVISLAMGSLILFETPEPALRISLQVLIPAVLLVSGFFIVVVWMAVKAQMRRPYSGLESIPEGKAEALTDIADEGKVFFQGEYWSAHSKEPIPKGAKVKILKIDGLKLTVEQIKNENQDN
ncbi:MAG TPA: nodulation protein NfeD [Deltaproteobacteria bacterium]|nr:nodulation protein NfeD [Deltaproteobacteria bacterium]